MAVENTVLGITLCFTI